MSVSPLRDIVFDFFRARLDCCFFGQNILSRKIHGLRAGQPPFVQRKHRIEHGTEPIVVVRSNRIVLVIVTLGTSHRDAQHRRANRLHGIGNRRVALFQRVLGLGTVRCETQKARGG